MSLKQEALDIPAQKDAIQSAWDTIIVVPFKFGMSLGNLSRLTGVFDKQENSDKSMNDVVRTALDKNDINFAAKREYVKNIKNSFKFR